MTTIAPSLAAESALIPDPLEGIAQARQTDAIPRPAPQPLITSEAPPVFVNGSSATGDVPVRPGAANSLLATLAVIAMVWWGQRFLIPLSAGVMLALLVLPLTGWMQRWLRVRVLVSALSLLVVLAGLVLAAVAFGGQLVRVAERMPEMVSLVAQRISETDTTSNSIVTRARDAFRELDRAADRLTGSKTIFVPVLTVPTRRNRIETPVTPVPTAAPDEASGSISETATVALKASAVTGSGALLKFAGDLTIIFFIAFFVLAGGKPLFERFLELWGDRPLGRQRAQSALRECMRQIRLYAGVLLVTNSAVGIAVWLAFLALGLPDAGGWGVTAAVLHMVPYLGMALLVGLGAAESFLAHGTVAAALGMAGFLVLMSTVMGTLVTAWLQSRAAKMNAATVFIGLVFWSMMWGVWGLFLGPALIVLIKVVAEHTVPGQRVARLMQG